MEVRERLTNFHGGLVEVEFYSGRKREPTSGVTENSYEEMFEISDYRSRYEAKCKSLRRASDKCVLPGWNVIRLMNDNERFTSVERGLCCYDKLNLVRIWPCNFQIEGLLLEPLSRHISFYWIVRVKTKRSRRCLLSK